VLTKQGGVPFWLYGVLAGLLLIVLVRSCVAPSADTLRGTFAPRPGDPTTADLPLPDLSLDSLPAQAQQAQATAVALLNLGQGAAPITPEVEGNGVRIVVDSLRREGEGIQVQGSITNTAGAARTIPAQALLFRDGSGQVYGGGTGSATLEPGQRAAIDMRVPIPEGSGLTLIFSLPPDPPLEMILLAATT
jgi:hypothetical protein